MTYAHSILRRMEVSPSEFSQRARAVVAAPRFNLVAPTEAHGERQYADGKRVWWSGREICEGWGYLGEWDLAAQALWEAAGVLLKQQNWGRLSEITPRELEFFLRDKNSQPALPQAQLESFALLWSELQNAVRQWLQSGVSLRPYQYTLNAPFNSLSLTDKIRELKAFFLSDKLGPYYQRGGQLELVDVYETTVYLALDTGDIPEGAFLDWLQIMCVEAFQEPSLNLIPEALPSAGSKKTV